MKIVKNSISLIVLLLLCVAGNAHAQDAEERQQLLERRDRLQANIETLKREQDFLLFQKEMYASDSKYLLLDLSAGTSELKYRNRTIGNFTVSSSRPAHGSPPSGAVVLTAKKEKEGKLRTLIFGNALVLQVKQKDGSERKDGGILRFSLLRRDMASLFYALDPGSRAYIVSGNR